MPFRAAPDFSPYSRASFLLRSETGYSPLLASPVSDFLTDICSSPLQERSPISPSYYIQALREDSVFFGLPPNLMFPSSADFSPLLPHRPPSSPTLPESNILYVVFFFSFRSLSLMSKGIRSDNFFLPPFLNTWSSRESLPKLKSSLLSPQSNECAHRTRLSHWRIF